MRINKTGISWLFGNPAQAARAAWRALPLMRGIHAGGTSLAASCPSGPLPGRALLPLLVVESRHGELTWNPP